jgi:DNA-binding transcriptional regulator YiaG
MGETPPLWDAERVRTLRERLGLTQRQLADELGVRQQTVSEWETGIYQPRGASARMLRVVAERSSASYDAGSGQWTVGNGEDPHAGSSPEG